MGRDGRLFPDNDGRMEKLNKNRIFKEGLTHVICK